MKNKILLSLMIIIYPALLVNGSAWYHELKTVSKKAEDKGFHQKEWLGVLQLKQHQSVNVHEFAK